MGRQAVFPEQLDRPIMLPSHVRAKKLSHQALGRHVQYRARRIELRPRPIQKARPGHRLQWQLIHHLRPGRAHIVLVGPGTEKTCPVGRILHRIRKGNQLLVVIERAGPTVLDHL